MWVPLGGPGSTWQPYGGGSPPPGRPQGSISGRGAITSPVSDAVTAARGMRIPQLSNQSYFPAANLNRFSDQSDLLRDAGNSFYGGGQAQPNPTLTPTATLAPTPIPRSYFGAQPNSQFTLPTTPQFNFGMNGRGNQMQDWLKQYGWSS